ncbi:MAG: hypothetical protein N7Q72_05410, partial [Spiroplasma sp. Tabriz.8]|nr:hypothetical protein [Spiroplasma sp. Tabriz.8]
TSIIKDNVDVLIEAFYLFYFVRVILVLYFLELFFCFFRSWYIYIYIYIYICIFIYIYIYHC